MFTAQDYNKEQDQIISIFRSKEKRTEGQIWSKYNGDLACRLVKTFAEPHLASKLQIVGPSVFVEGNPTEWDLLLVDSGIQPMPYTSCYAPDHVRGVVEVKSKGHINRSDPIRLRKRFDSLRKSVRKATCIYITLTETRPKRETSKRKWLLEMTKALEPKYSVICLADMGSLQKPGPLIEGQWEKFRSTLKLCERARR